ncbi:hypothetical protein EYA84_11055 [Verrucosispora sp. SN26_14.1]|uniref:hypothetical protein n=1 Tax=Verrucosispora sp. SN26_14.1 TaxID=2527879 RepID=UPI00103328F9|nr:hypothetical protein [Verrucosispora sp. SN26_14.1]TBL37253.1 hypothetical protein EYA84_11055 [Verrucosispora sp. SN26_14.1]
MTEHPSLALHHLLLRLDGHFPDDLVSEARTWLAEGLVRDVAEAVVFTALTGDVALTAADVVVLSETLSSSGADTAALAEVRRTDGPPLPMYALAPADPTALAEQRLPAILDLTSGYVGPGAPDPVDTAIVASMPALTGVEALWRSWRYPTDGTPPRRVYLVHRPDGALPSAAARLQAVLREAGESTPLVQVFDDEPTLPAQHRIALDCAALLWTSRPPAPVRFAESPGFAPDQPRLDGPDRDRVLTRLAYGVPLLTTATFLDDALDRTRTGTVPTDLRTDGEWIWSDMVTYYLDRHRLAPGPTFLAHLRACGPHPPQVGPAALHRARAALWATTTGRRETARRP